MYEIEKDVEMPSIKSKYPFANMALSNSFSFAPEQRPMIAAAAWHYIKKHGGKFSTRVINDEGRCWRIE